MTRTTAADLGTLGELDATATLRGLGFRVEPGTSAGDLVAALDDREVRFHVTGISYADPNRIAQLVRHRSAGRTPMLVADRIPPAARALLDTAGWSWLDRSGRFHVRASGVLIDADVAPAPRSGAEQPDRSPLRGRTGRTVAYQLLLEPDRALRPNADAATLGMAPSSLSDVLKRLRAAGLVDDDGLPQRTELFRELAGQWDGERRWLANAPSAVDWPDDLATPDRGWCLTGTRAAAVLGADVVTVVGGPPELYVPGPVVLTIAVRRLGEAADPTTAAASISVPATGLALQHRRPPTRRSDGWAVAHPLAVALELAQDPSRGREILETWDGDGARVW